MRQNIGLRFFLLITLICKLLSGKAEAGQFILTNGDILTGTITSKTESAVILEHSILGTITIPLDQIQLNPSQKEFIHASDTAAPKPEKESPWTAEASAGYNVATGNTETEELAADIKINRKTDKDEFTIKGDSYYASSDNVIDSQKAYGMIRYAFSFGATKKWYNFYKTEAEHDRFANIKYRITPSTGLGYWFSDTDDWKLLTETGIGYEYTEYRDDTDSDGEIILIPRLFFEKALFSNSRFSQDITMYPSLSELGEYRVRSESSFINPINGHISLKLSLIDEYNSDPADDTKKNDLRFISSLMYSF